MKNFLTTVVGTSILMMTLTGCGLGNSVQEREVPKQATAAPVQHNAIHAGDVTVSVYGVEDTLYKLIIKNDKEQSETLSFSDSKLYEYEILDREGKRVFKHSDGKGFAQMLMEQEVLAGEIWEAEVDISEGLDGLEVGDYTLVVWSVAQGFEKKRVEVPLNVTEEMIATAASPNGGEELGATDQLVAITEVTFLGMIDSNSIETEASNGDIQVYRLIEEVKATAAALELGDLFQMEYQKIDDQFVITQIFE